MADYIVNRQHYGDQLYNIGDTRTARESDVAHLVEKGVLTAKAERTVKNKAEKPAKNKAAE